MKDVLLLALSAHEVEALLEALRRDLRHQSRAAECRNHLMDWHRHNARMSKRLLEAINPKAVRTDDLTLLAFQH
jgi:isopenicillin N synthase-like dioxygenase